MAKSDQKQTTDTLELPEQPKQSYFKTAPRTSVVFKLKDAKTQGTVSIPLTEDVTDPATGKPRRMRVLRGVPTIWMDEQKHQDSIKGFVEKNQVSLHFQKGSAAIPIHEENTIQGARLSNRNVDNPKRVGAPREMFFEWDSEKLGQKELESELLEIDAVTMAGNMPLDDMIPHAQYLGVDFIDPHSGQALQEAGIRRQYILKAKREPKKFMDSVKSPIVRVGATVRQAISNGKIDIGREAGAAYWSDGGFISAIPLGRDAAEYLIEYAMLPGEKNVAFASQLKELS